MPNECENNLRVYGPKELVKKFSDDNTGDEGKALSFAKSLPVPEGEDAFAWHCERWGTKWDVMEVIDYSEDDNGSAEDKGMTTYRYAFTTAWSPPIEWLKGVAEKYPELTFSMNYIEQGMEFAGDVEVKGDTILMEETYDSDHPEYKLMAGEDEEDDEDSEDEEEN
jgi:hypothetical protein